eukprot:TRINITY_DN2828_c0_g1_i2.p1 TRINITY_DN2828_c0_g1~~TRINITY_DN2828_c0_g1_i2.p1  ORF type:complete len:717 (-),score=101.32 TRINITY_DN2828_c0_g1_i2:108-2258(-)
MGCRSKEAYVVCVDVGQHMLLSTKHAASQAVSSLAVSHVMHMPSWYLSIITFGSAVTNIPDFAEDVVPGFRSQFHNINVLQDLSPPSMDLVNTAKTISNQAGVAGCSNFFDVLMVACQVLSQANVESKVVKKIIVVSNFIGQINTVQDNFLSQLQQLLRSMDVLLEVVCLEDHLSEGNKEGQQQNLESISIVKEYVKHWNLTKVSYQSDLSTIFKAMTIMPLSRGASSGLDDIQMEEGTRQLPDDIRLDNYFVAPIITPVQNISWSEDYRFLEIQKRPKIDQLQRPKEGDNLTFAFIQNQSGSWGLEILSAEQMFAELILGEQLKPPPLIKKLDDDDDETDDVKPHDLFINESSVIQYSFDKKRRRPNGFFDQKLKRQRVDWYDNKLYKRGYLKKILNGLSIDHFVFMQMYPDILKPVDVFVEQYDDNLNDVKDAETKLIGIQIEVRETPSVFYDPTPFSRSVRRFSNQIESSQQQQQQEKNQMLTQQKHQQKVQVQIQEGQSSQRDSLMLKDSNNKASMSVEVKDEQIEKGALNNSLRQLQIQQQEDVAKDINNDSSKRRNNNEEQQSESSEEFSEDYDSDEPDLETQEGESHQAVIPPMLDVRERTEEIPSQEIDLIGQLVCHRISKHVRDQEQILSAQDVGEKLGFGYMGLIVGRDWDLQDKWLFCQGLCEIGKRDFNALQKDYLQHKTNSQLVSYYYNVWKIEKYNSEILIN